MADSGSNCSVVQTHYAVHLNVYTQQLWSFVTVTKLCDCHSKNVPDIWKHSAVMAVSIYQSQSAGVCIDAKPVSRSQRQRWISAKRVSTYVGALKIVISISSTRAKATAILYHTLSASFVSLRWTPNASVSKVSVLVKAEQLCVIYAGMLHLEHWDVRLTKLESFSSKQRLIKISGIQSDSDCLMQALQLCILFTHYQSKHL